MIGERMTIQQVDNGYITKIYAVNGFTESETRVFQTLEALAGHIAEHGIGEVKPKTEAVKTAPIARAQVMECSGTEEKETIHVTV